MQILLDRYQTTLLSATTGNFQGEKYSTFEEQSFNDERVDRREDDSGGVEEEEERLRRDILRLSTTYERMFGIQGADSVKLFVFEY